MTLAARWFGGVIFDLDGTVIYSEPSIQRAWTRWAQEVGLTEADFADQSWHGMPSAAVVAQVLPELPPAECARLTDRLTELEIADAASVVALPGTSEALAALSEVPVAIATSCTSALAAARIAGAGLPPLKVVVTTDLVARGKPSPDIFLLAAQRLGVPPTDVLVVEDSVAGLTAARAAGAATLAVLTTTAADELAADGLVSDLSAVTWRVVDGRISVEFNEV